MQNEKLPDKSLKFSNTGPKRFSNPKMLCVIQQKILLFSCAKKSRHILQISVGGEYSSSGNIQGFKVCYPEKNPFISLCSPPCSASRKEPGLTKMHTLVTVSLKEAFGQKDVPHHNNTAGHRRNASLRFTNHRNQEIYNKVLNSTKLNIVVAMQGTLDFMS